MSASEEWSRAGWRAHLPRTGDLPAYVGRLGEATIPELAAASAGRVPARIAVVMRPGGDFDQGALIVHARAALAGYKCPKQVFQLDALPRNHVGKVVRSALTPRGAG
jgi:hypothetical protein